MPHRLKLIVAYDGTPFAGWQSQPGGNTIQDHLERAVVAVTGKSLRVHGAGRTDAGVHALAQSAHFELPERSLPANRWPAALNASLPPTIRVMSCRYVPAEFHARFSARGKIYRYRVWNDDILPPLELNRAWHVHARVDLNLLRQAAQIFVGTHDFAGFAANRGKPEQSTVRTIDSVRLRQNGRCIEIDFSGNGFLYRMVRLMVGGGIRSALGRISIEELRRRLNAPGHAPAGPRPLAPACGLFLERVRY